jgi:ABC-type branched-subunit amino acid transport system substrate-binding protein
MLKQIDLELTTNPESQEYKNNVASKNYKKKYDELKSKFFKMKENYIYTKKMEEMILSSQNDSQEGLNDSATMLQMQSKNILDQEKLVSNSTEKIENAKRSVLTVENMSKNVMIDLESQTQKIQSTNAKVVLMNNSIDSSNTIITKMMNRENRNKAIVGLFSVTLLTFFLFILSSRI